MIASKKDFITTFLDDKIEDVSFVQIDMDISDLSIGDILRNINQTFPQNSRSRNKIINGEFAVAVLCRSELLEPLNGLLIIVASDGTNIEIVSKNHIVISVSESKICTDPDIVGVIDGIEKYIIKMFKNTLREFTSFFVKFVYDPTEDFELEEEEDRIYSKYL